ncbi:MAG TPA: hypothetical protein PKD51_10560 [Saprospiraceae bacterium]|nr:hypothetical protein [Saprospiraceae bacterium]HMU06022.1 hypothetical protein [Saprospiraceae bacterium]
MLPSSTLRTQIYPIIENFFKPLGWKYAKMPHRFEFRNDRWVFYLSWSFTRPSVDDYVTLHKEIDDIKRELKLHVPGLNPITYSRDGFEKFTLKDSRCAYTFTPNIPNGKFGTPEYGELLKSRYCQPINTLQDMDNWIDSIYEYISGTGMDYIEEYKYLPNLLRLLDNEIDEPNRVWNSIVAGGFHRFTDVMLVSQLCSDTNMEKKLDYVEKVLQDTEWPRIGGESEYWEAFLKILPTIKSRYPHYSKLSEEDLRKYNPPLFKRRLE